MNEATGVSEKKPTFEEALQELSQIVGVLEEGSTGLEQSLASFERGVSLLRTCHQLLARAEQQIELLTGFSATGAEQTEPFDATATADQPDSAVGRRQSVQAVSAQTVQSPRSARKRRAVPEVAPASEPISPSLFGEPAGQGEVQPSVEHPDTPGFAT